MKNNGYLLYDITQDNFEEKLTSDEKNPLTCICERAITNNDQFSIV